ncbi:unnamed protein product [Pipistrellus nathusii]|uniref:Uncharacterized protein n=1 Tax=Pipistrellus nathusii TaxID=59473 RepID=A0ABN9Z872_PIPNA
MGESQVSMRLTEDVVLCRSKIQSGSENKVCVYNSQRWDLNHYQFPTASQACCISGVLGFGLKVKWQVFGPAEQGVLREAQYQGPQGAGSNKRVLQDCCF